MASREKYPYANYMNIKFEPLEIVDVPSLVSSCTDQWYNQTLSKVNDSVIRLGIMQGEYHWHKHDDDVNWRRVFNQSVPLFPQAGDRGNKYCLRFAGPAT